MEEIVDLCFKDYLSNLFFIVVQQSDDNKAHGTCNTIQKQW